MCGIVGAVSTRNIVPIPVQGLQRLEYRGYDSCGVAVHARPGRGGRWCGARGIAAWLTWRRSASAEHHRHHRHRAHAWAGAANNAHPHAAWGRTARADGAERPGRVALVHNGIIENHEALRAELQARGYLFCSQTDTEVIAHLIDSLYDGDLFEAGAGRCASCMGAYAIAVMHKRRAAAPVAARRLAAGAGHRRRRQENFLASDAMALAGVTDQIVYLEEGDLVDLQLGRYWIVDRGATASA